MNTVVPIHFETGRQVGETYPLPLNHVLATSEYPVRLDELQAIARWASENDVLLRDESCLDVQRVDGIPVKASVFTYSYIPQVQMAQPEPVYQRRVLVEREFA